MWYFSYIFTQLILLPTSFTIRFMKMENKSNLTHISKKKHINYKNTTKSAFLKKCKNMQYKF